jgi:acyl carrier protein
MEFEKIREIVAEQMSVDIDKITMDTSFTKDLGADSLDVYQIVSELETVFGMEFSNEDAEKIVTIGDAVNYLKSLR